MGGLRLKTCTKQPEYANFEIDFIMSKIRYYKLRLLFLFWHESTSAARFSLALGAMLWGLMLFWPGETFGRPTYALMARFAPEEVWAALFCAQGAYAVYSLITDARGKFAFLFEGVLGCMLWTGSCISMLLSVYPPPAAIAGEIALAVASWWHLVRFPFPVSKDDGRNS